MENLFESGLERKILTILLASTLYTSVLEQPPAVQFIDDDGNDCTHTLDFFVIERDGTRVAVAVKPAEWAEKTLRRIVDLIKAQVGRKFADRYVILTDADAHPDDVADAHLVLRSRRSPNPAADDAVRALVSTINGWTSVRAVVNAAGFGSDGYHALVRLISGGGVQVLNEDRISYDAFINRDHTPTIEKEAA